LKFFIANIGLLDHSTILVFVPNFQDSRHVQCFSVIAGQSWNQILCNTLEIRGNPLEFILTSIPLATTLHF